MYILTYYLAFATPIIISVCTTVCKVNILLLFSLHLYQVGSATLLLAFHISLIHHHLSPYLNSNSLPLLKANLNFYVISYDLCPYDNTPNRYRSQNFFFDVILWRPQKKLTSKNWIAIFGCALNESQLKKLY